MIEALFAYLFDNIGPSVLWLILVVGVGYVCVKVTTILDKMKQFEKDFDGHIAEDRQGFSDMKEALVKHSEESKESDRKLHDRINKNSEDIKSLEGYVRGRVEKSNVKTN